MSENSIAYHHNHYISEDPAAAASWYADKLGGRLVGGPDALKTAPILVTFKGVMLIIRSRNEGEVVGAKQGTQWGLDHIGFHVDGDFDAYCDELKAKGVVFTLDPMDLNPNLCIAFIEAPDGASIELLQQK
jgi:catechol 2,3-dioxygenase-like lactoylglutathione lyase family enzyme